jgi:hypothetical protein
VFSSKTIKIKVLKEGEKKLNGDWIINKLNENDYAIGGNKLNFKI